MIFTSLVFLVFFAALLVLLLFIRNDTVRVWLLLIGSYIFYGYWNAYYLILIFCCSFWGWGLGLLMYRSGSEMAQRVYLGLSLVLSLGSLGFFKYANFFGENMASLLQITDWEPWDIVLPVGISFFTFQTMSYNIDLYRGRIEVCRSPVKFALFVSFFPQLVAGPIVRASEFLPQLQRRIHLTWDNFVIGSQLFLGGAIQKTLFADNLSVFVDGVYHDPSLFSPSTLWLAVAAYSMQIFCDFAGYSLMAIGIGRILGFALPENFRMPYLSLSVTEFWRRWHISLSSWLRDYLYISLGGNRKGPTRTQVNMMITMLLGGLWHGASWNFILWGAMHGAALAVNRRWDAWRERRGTLGQEGPVYKVVAWAATLLFCSLVWVPFRSPDFATTKVFLAGLLPGGGGSVDWYHSYTVVVLLAAVVWHAAYQFWPALLRTLPFPPAVLARLPAMLVVGFAVMLVFIFAPVNTSPFIYFQF